MLFAKVITVPVLVPIVISSCQTYYILLDIVITTTITIHSQTHQTRHSQGYVSYPLETWIKEWKILVTLRKTHIQIYST